MNDYSSVLPLEKTTFDKSIFESNQAKFSENQLNVNLKSLNVWDIPYIRDITIDSDYDDEINEELDNQNWIKMNQINALLPDNKPMFQKSIKFFVKEELEGKDSNNPWISEYGINK